MRVAGGKKFGENNMSVESGIHLNYFHLTSITLQRIYSTRMIITNPTFCIPSASQKDV